MPEIISGSYLIIILWKIFVYAIVALSLNFVIGYCGMFNLGQVGFVAVGGLCSTIAFMNSGVLHGTHAVVGIVLGMSVSAILALCIGLPSLRLRGDYFAIATLGFAEIVRVIIKSNDELTARPPKLDPLFGSIPYNEIYELLLVFVCLVIVFLIMQRFVKSPFGRLVKAVRDDEDAASALGKNTYIVKLKVFVIGAMIASFAGSLFVYHVMGFKADDFNIMLSITFLVIVIFGGLGSNMGAVLGTVIIVLIEEIPKVIGTKVEWLGDFITGPVNLLIFSVIIILVMLFRPKGLMGGREFIDLRGVRKRIAERFKSGLQKIKRNDKGRKKR